MNEMIYISHKIGSTENSIKNFGNKVWNLKLIRTYSNTL